MSHCILTQSNHYSQEQCNPRWRCICHCLSMTEWHHLVWKRMMKKMRTSNDDTKQCRKCLRTLPVTNFRFTNISENKRHNICRACRQIHRQVTRNANREEYETLLEKQNNVCAICGITAEEIGKKLVIDHNHETLKIRGLLCWRCNSGLGFFKDNQAHLAMAIEYLVRNDDAS